LTNDALIAGAPSFSLETGSAWVAQRVEGSPSGFGEPVGLTPSWLEAADALGESVAIDGGTAVVGAPGARVILPGSPPVEYAGAGRAFVFQRDARGIWVEIASLRSPAPNQFAAFGAGVDIDGDTVAIGEPNRQCVQIFERNQGGPNAWGHARTIAPSIFSQDLGRSVSLDGDLLVAGAQTENAPLNDSGAAYLFGRDQGGPGNWGLIKKLLASNAAASDRFGCAVAIDGDIVAVGASGVDGSASSPNFGRAYVFEQDLGGDDNWGERTQLHAGAFGRANMEFGKDISVSVNLVLVGAPSKASPFFNPGSAFVFQRDAGGPNSWGGVARMVPRQPAVDDRFGIAVVLDGTTAVVGADYRDHQAPFVGALFVMDVAGADCNINGFCDSFDVLSNASPDDNGNGIPDECEQPTCPADIAGNDGQVDVNDLLAVITTWGPCPAPPTACDADIDNSGTVDVNDLLAVITTWGTCP